MTEVGDMAKAGADVVCSGCQSNQAGRKSILGKELTESKATGGAVVYLSQLGCSPV